MTESARSANAISGEISGQAVQAGIINGDIHFHQHAAGLGHVIPRQLPPPPANFANRSRELSTLEDSVADGALSVILLKGPGGVGKTALALHWLGRSAERFPDGQLYADLTMSNGEPVLVDDVLGQFLRALGLAPQRVPTGLAERAALYRSVTARTRLALLLDNAISAAQVRVLLPASTGAVVVTSRYALPGLLAAGAISLAVDPLDDNAALDLLGGSIGPARVDEEPAPARQLVDLCAGLPLALCIAGARVALRPRRPLARLVAELVDEHRRLDALSVFDDLSVRGTFDLAYADLTPEQQQVYRAMGAHPGQLFDAGVIAAATGAPAERVIEELVDASLVEELADGRYRLHDLVRVHARDQSGQHERAAMVHRMIRWYLDATRAAAAVIMPARPALDFELAENTFPDMSSALTWLEDNRPTLIEAIRAAVDAHLFREAYLLADAMQPLFIVHRHDRDVVVVGELVLPAIESLGEAAGYAEMRKRVARAYAVLGDQPRSLALATDMLAAARTEHDRRAEASALRSLALLHARFGERAEAVAEHEAAVEILRELGQDRARALSLIDLGLTLLELGRPFQAADRLTEARHAFSRLTATDEFNEARADAALGAALAGTGSVFEARALLADALRRFMAQQADHETARTHRWIADLARYTGDPTTADRHTAAAADLDRPGRA
ncbi:MAG TPA: NB-ARC domain-containing protein [Pseudonocardiaceae bacterium]|nr:NB-ARC domain-containing protein [Pseudonocardiaceae bacterium]